MASPYHTDKIAQRSDVHIQIPDNISLLVGIFLNNLNRLLVQVSFVPKYTIQEYFFKGRSIYAPLAPRYLRHMFTFFLVISDVLSESSSPTITCLLKSTGWFFHQFPNHEFASTQRWNRSSSH